MTERPELRANAGDLICFSTGEYSDYSYAGHFVALEEIRAEHFEAARTTAQQKYDEYDRATDEWAKDSGNPYPQYVSKHEAFIAALIKAGLLMSVSVTEHHIGSYGDIEIS